jgi:hypothetical protein
MASDPRIYHDLVRHDLLPRLLHLGIVDAYDSLSVDFLDPQAGRYGDP